MFKLRNKAFWGQWVPLPLRLIIGFGFMAHGWAKLQPGTVGLREAARPDRRTASRGDGVGVHVRGASRRSGDLRGGLRRGREHSAHRHDARGDVHRAPEVRLQLRQHDRVDRRGAAVRPAGLRGQSPVHRGPGLADLGRRGGVVHRPPSCAQRRCRTVPKGTSRPPDPIRRASSYAFEWRRNTFWARRMRPLSGNSGRAPRALRCRPFRARKMRRGPDNSGLAPRALRCRPFRARRIRRGPDNSGLAPRAIRCRPYRARRIRRYPDNNSGLAPELYDVARSGLEELGGAPTIRGWRPELYDVARTGLEESGGTLTTTRGWRPELYDVARTGLEESGGTLTTTRGWHPSSTMSPVPGSRN